MLEFLKRVLFVEHADITFICIAVLLVTIAVLISVLVKQHSKWKDKIADTEHKADTRIKAEQKRHEEAISAERARAAEDIATEQKRSHDELEMLRRNINADKMRLDKMTEKDLMITTLLTLDKLAYRLDTLEKQGASIERGVLESNHLLAAKQENSPINMDENEYTHENYGMFDSDEHIRCGSRTDENTVDLLYNSLHGDNKDTYTADNLVDAMSALDSNVYNLCKAIIYQNFMSMRKVDKLYDIVKRSEG